MAVVIETTLGDFTIDLFTEDRPQTCKNFLKLCKIKYYNFCLFHSVQANFLAQTGDPTGSGTGGESIFGIVYGDKARYYEAEKLPKLKHSKPGLLSMVNCGDNMLGSQFFLTLGNELQSLDEHCIFAEITEGMEILLKLNEAICDNQHRPYQDIRITHTVILEDPFEDPTGLVVPSASPEPSQLTLQNGRIGADEEIDETAGMTAAEVEEMKQSREAQARATILEIVGDLPDAEMAPPENVLFVCKLNPVTNDDDLEIIFSRFGKVKSCEVIRDHETGDSLQYAFIEFEEQRACEEAYFKMDNVLIDDRRIHVDFSQSVAKMRWKGKGRGVEYLDKNEKDKNQFSGDSRSSSRRENIRDSRGENYHDGRDENHRENRDENHRESRDWNHRKRQDEERQRRREVNNDNQRTDKRKYDDSRKSNDRRRHDGFKSREGNNQRLENRKSHDRRDFNITSRREDSRRRVVDRRENDFRKNDSFHKDDRGKEKGHRSSSRNRSHSTEQFRDRNHSSPLVTKSKENGEDEKVGRVKNAIKSSRDKHEKEVSLNSSFTTSSDIADSKMSDERAPTKATEVDEDCKSKPPKPLEIESSASKEPSKLRECSIGSEKKLKRKKKSEEYKSRKKRKTSTTSDSSSAASDSSNSSSSSESASSDHKRKHKHHKTVAKKYYHRGKLVKIVKKKRDTSESESFTDSSSDSDRKRKRKKGRKKHTKKIVKIIEKRRFDSSDESGSDSSSSDDSENERSKKRRRRKTTDKKKKKKKRNNSIKKHKKVKSDESSDSESEEKTSTHKTKKNKKESITTQTSD